ncbi:hypothetical protein AAHA92_34126 [Salvia divinorum]|uniref:Uncharacterized protein n=2 Tax=Salvia divinorum TaxID=28513 RepID=A0ABD1FHB6_SALDI
MGQQNQLQQQIGRQNQLQQQQIGQNQLQQPQMGQMACANLSKSALMGQARHLPMLPGQATQFNLDNQFLNWPHQKAGFMQGSQSHQWQFSWAVLARNASSGNDGVNQFGFSTQSKWPACLRPAKNDTGPTEAAAFTTKSTYCWPAVGLPGSGAVTYMHNHISQ